MECKTNSRKKYYIIFLSILIMSMSCLCSFADYDVYACFKSESGHLLHPVNGEYVTSVLDINTVRYREYFFYETSANDKTYIVVPVSVNGQHYFTYNDVTYGVVMYSSYPNVHYSAVGYYSVNDINLSEISVRGVFSSDKTVVSMFKPLFSSGNSNNYLVSTKSPELLATLNITKVDLYINSQVTLCSINNLLVKGGFSVMSVITEILAVFTAMGQWFVSIIPTVLAVFWTPGTDGADGSLTIIGALAVASLAIAVILLILAWVVNFFKFRGQ